MDVIRIMQDGVRYDFALQQNRKRDCESVPGQSQKRPTFAILTKNNAEQASMCEKIKKG